MYDGQRFVPIGFWFDSEAESPFRKIDLQAGPLRKAEDIDGMFSLLGHNQIPENYRNKDTYFRWYRGSETQSPLLMRVTSIRRDDRGHLHAFASRASLVDRGAVAGKQATEIIIVGKTTMLEKKGNKTTTQAVSPYRITWWLSPHLEA